jgi:hypothetical protein
MGPLYSDNWVNEYGLNQPRNFIDSNPYDGETSIFLTEFWQALQNVEVCSIRQPYNIEITTFLNAEKIWFKLKKKLFSV